MAEKLLVTHEELENASQNFKKITDNLENVKEKLGSLEEMLQGNWEGDTAEHFFEVVPDYKETVQAQADASQKAQEEIDSYTTTMNQTDSDEANSWTDESAGTSESGSQTDGAETADTSDSGSSEGENQNSDSSENTDDTDNDADSSDDSDASSESGIGSTADTDNSGEESASDPVEETDERNWFEKCWDSVTDKAQWLWNQTKYNADRVVDGTEYQAFGSMVLYSAVSHIPVCKGCIEDSAKELMKEKVNQTVYERQKFIDEHWDGTEAEKENEKEYVENSIADWARNPN